MEPFVVQEYIACVLLAILIGYALFDKNRHSFKETVFRVSLLVCLFCVGLNILAVYLTPRSMQIPRWLNAVVHHALFVFTALMTAAVTTASIVSLTEDWRSPRRLLWSLIPIWACGAVLIALVAINPATGWLFSFGADQRYAQGPLCSIYTAYLFLCVLFTVLCYLRERKHLRRSAHFIVYTVPPLTAVLGILQYLFPNVVMTGTIAVCALIVLFISGQQQRINVDALTELPSREAFYQAIERMVAHNRIFWVIVVGLRDYKQINNHFGQRMGDRFLREVGGYLLGLDHHMVAYRFSGVEFALIASDMPAEEYEALFANLIRRFDAPWTHDSFSLTLRAAFADIAYPAHADSLNELIASLEYATRLAKSGAPGRPVRFDKRYRSEFGRRNYVLSQLESALREDRFFLYFQPVYDCQRRCFTGGEVLLRLNEENGRPISPGEFIPLAIESGIASELGYMVLEKTCRFLQDNPDESIEWLSVNISAQQYEFEETFGRLECLLKQYHIPPSRIKLEITERVIIDDLDSAAATMRGLNLLGTGIFLDDFGTGYSNLVNVMSLPFACVKIDKGFIRRVAQSSKSYGMLETMVHGLRQLCVNVLAEGIETPEQDEIVKRLGIDMIQGYYYARPMPGEEFAWLLRQSNRAQERA